MPKRWCQCTGCSACLSTGQQRQPRHGALFDLDLTGTQKCPPCQTAATTARNARPSSSQRGLGWAFTRRKQNDPNYVQATTCQCTGCPQHRGICGVVFTPANPKTAGHTTPRSRGGGNGPILPVCRRCNSSDGGRIAHDH